MPAYDIPRAIVAELIQRAHASPEHEVCGLLAGNITPTAYHVSACYPIPNSHPTPATHFHMEPRQFVQAMYAIAATNLALVGIYHSHPNGSPQPSSADIAAAAYAVPYVIIADGQLHGWKIEAGQVAILRLNFI